jgi:hypothetical protein
MGVRKTIEKELEMSQLVHPLDSFSAARPPRLAAAPLDHRPACRMAAWATLLGFACTLGTILTVTLAGAEPSTAAEYYDVLLHDGLAGLLRLDFASILHVALLPATAFGLYTALRQRFPTAALVPAALALAGMAMALSANSAFSMIDLAGKYALAGGAAGGVAGGAAERQQLLAAGEAVIAQDWYSSSGGFVAAFFLQGSFMALSVLMLKSRSFGRPAAVAGLLSNGLDLAHVVVNLFLPGLAAGMMAVAGVFYLAWYPLLFRELRRL